MNPVQNNQPLYDLNEIQAMDLTPLRNSDLKVTGWVVAMCVIPVFGWIALIWRKCSYMAHHRAAEQIMQGYNAEASLTEKESVLYRAKAAAGPLGWQYQLELARVYLLAEKMGDAARELKTVMNERGGPRCAVSDTDFRKDLISVRGFTFNVMDSLYEMSADYFTGNEALLAAVAFAGTEQYVKAYDAYNEVMLYNGFLDSTRTHQYEVVKKISAFNPVLLNGRGREIYLAEKTLRDKFNLPAAS